LSDGTHLVGARMVDVRTGDPATGPTNSGFLTVWPTGASQPTVSNLNFVAGQTVPNLVKVGLGTNG
jgi:hypothetical protein